MTNVSEHLLDFAVVIGRWQLPHFGHARLFETALDRAQTVIVVIGSAFRSRDSRNPFSWQEREHMIRAQLGKDSERVVFLPVRDYYDDERWAGVVSDEVQRIARPGARIGLVGYRKDQTTAYLNRFPQWLDIKADPLANLDATGMRRVFFESDDVDSALNVLEPYVHEKVRSYLQAWSGLPEYERCVNEARAVTAYRKRWTGSHYLTADAIVKCQNRVLLIQRGGEIGYDQWALPGGFVDPGERFYDACLRELKEETCLSLLGSTMAHALRDSEVFDHPLRSARGGIVTRAFFFDLGNMPLPEVKAQSDAKGIDWVLIDDLPKMEHLLFEDHACILDRHVGLYPKRVSEKVVIHG